MTKKFLAEVIIDKKIIQGSLKWIKGLIKYTWPSEKWSKIIERKNNYRFIFSDPNLFDHFTTTNLFFENGKHLTVIVGHQI